MIQLTIQDNYRCPVCARVGIVELHHQYDHQNDEDVSFYRCPECKTTARRFELVSRSVSEASAALRSITPLDAGAAVPTVSQKLAAIRGTIKHLKRLVAHYERQVREGAAADLSAARKIIVAKRRLGVMEFMEYEHRVLMAQGDNAVYPNVRGWTCPDCGQTQNENAGRVLVFCQNCKRGPYILRPGSERTERIVGVDYDLD